MSWLNVVGRFLGHPEDAAVTIPVLSVVDNEDGTGGVATITGGDPDADNEVWIVPVSGLQSMEAESAGSRSGPGTVNIAAGVGYYIVFCISTLGHGSGVSNFVYLKFKNSDTAVAEDVLLAVAAKIDSLVLDGMSNATIIHKVPTTKPSDIPESTPFPCVIIAAYNPEAMDAYTDANIVDDTGYAVQITVIRNDETNQTTERNEWLLWREQIRKAFQNKRLLGVDSVYTCMITPGAVFDPAAWLDRNLAVGSMIVRAMSRETRD